MAAAAAGGAAPGGPRPNPSDDGPRLRSPTGKGKPVALADITNTGRRSATGSISIADLVKENAKLVHLLNEKTRAMELSGVEVQKLRFAVQVLRQQNLQLAQANSQMLAELNLGKDRLKAMQHELSCATAVIKVKDSELEKRNKAANQRRKEVNTQDGVKVIPSKVAAGVAHQIDGSVTSATEHHLVESTSVATSVTLCQEPSNDIGIKRGRNKRKFVSSDCSKVMHDHCGPQMQTAMSLGHEDTRRPVRRSTRLNPVSCEDTEIACSILPEGDLVPSDPSSLINQKQHGPTTGKDMRNSLQDERSHEGVMTSGSKEIQEACSSLPGIEVNEIGDTACKTTGSYSAETQCNSPHHATTCVHATASLPFNIAEPLKAVEDTGNERGASKQTLQNGKDLAMERANAKCDSRTREPLHDEKRKCQRRKSSRLNSVLPENTMSTSETLPEDVSSLPHSSSNPSMEQANQKQADDGSSRKVIEGQVAGRRSLRRAAEKVVSYKEMPLNIKMRRP